MHHKNWSAICKIANPLFRLAVAMMDEPQPLAKLAIGFPELFSDEPEREGPFPVSVIRNLQERLSTEEWGTECAMVDRELNWGKAMRHLSIPEIYFDEGKVPNDIIQQLMGQTIACGMKVVYNGIDMVVTQCNVAWTFGKMFGEEELKEVYLGISPAKFFDFNA